MRISYYCFLFQSTRPTVRDQTRDSYSINFHYFCCVPTSKRTMELPIKCSVISGSFLLFAIVFGWVIFPEIFKFGLRHVSKLILIFFLYIDSFFLLFFLSHCFQSLVHFSSRSSQSFFSVLFPWHFSQS